MLALGNQLTGSSLKKRKLNPPKKRGSIDAYRNMTAQNAWLLSNVYDSRGNYIFCQECVKYYLGIGKQRMSRLRRIKASRSQMPTISMTKREVCSEKLEAKVVMPASSF